MNLSTTSTAREIQLSNHVKRMSIMAD